MTKVDRKRRYVVKGGRYMFDKFPYCYTGEKVNGEYEYHQFAKKLFTKDEAEKLLVELKKEQDEKDFTDNAHKRIFAIIRLDNEQLNNWLKQGI
jgi:hypothetical protein